MCVGAGAGVGRGRQAANSLLQPNVFCPQTPLSPLLVPMNPFLPVPGTLQNSLNVSQILVVSQICPMTWGILLPPLFLFSS